MQPFISESDSFLAFSASMSCEAFAASTLAEEVESHGLFVAPTAAEEVASGDERRTKLFPWDSVQSQLFEPWGESSLDSLSLDQVWQGACKGNEKTRYHSHLCANLSTDGWHLGISQTAEVLLLAIKNWQSQDMQRLVKDDLYARVNAEIATLEPALKVLNVGKGWRLQVGSEIRGAQG